MGCGESRQAKAQDKKVITDLTKVNLDTLSRAERFEMMVPVTLTDVDVFCKTIRAIKGEAKAISAEDLMTGMSAIDAWRKVPADSIFHKVLKESPLLKDSESPELLSKNALLLWGIVLSGGKSAIKVKAFYDVLQDSNQERISADDKDFPGNFFLMINLATALVNDYEAQFSGQDPERGGEVFAALERSRETLAENEFLDHVFGPHSNLTRQEWEDAVLRNVKWIFDSTKVRAHIYGKLEKP